VSSTAPPPSTTPNKADCSAFYPKDNLATITVRLREKNGKPLSGEWTVKIKSYPECPAIFPYGMDWTSGYIQGGASTWTSVGFNPGKVRMDVNYHRIGQAYDIDATPGNHIIEMEVVND